MILTTDRLIIRDFVESDWYEVHQYSADPEVTRFMFFEVNTEDQTRAYLHRCLTWAQERPRLMYGLGIVLQAENRVIGSCTLAITDHTSRQGAFSYLLHRHYWGRGYATEVLRALVAFGFDELGLHRIADDCDARNIVSARVMEKVGLRCEGHLREHIYAKGRWCNSLIYAILEEEWRAQAHHRAPSAAGKAQR